MRRDSAQPGRDAFTAFIDRELQLNPARWRSIARITVGCTVTVAISMVFQIPLPAYVAYIVFLLSHEEAAATVIAALGGLVAATIAVALSLLLYVFDASEPAVRLSLLAVSTLGGSFLARTLALGPIAFLAGFVLVLSQTILDDVPTTEYLTHLILWLWVVVLVPVATTIAINLIAGESPVRAAHQRACEAMDDVARFIQNPSALDGSHIREEVLSIIELRKHAVIWNKSLSKNEQRDAHLLELLCEILAIAQALPSDTSARTRIDLSDHLHACAREFDKPTGVVRASRAEIDEPADDRQPAADALYAAIQEFDDVLSARPGAAPPLKEAKPPARLFLDGAFTDRSHRQFAFKVMCAVMASYITYSLLDWPGISTCITTCFFVSLTSFGESMHKLSLRLTGAIVGGLLAGLCIVFVIPLLTDIGQLCVLIAVASALFAWVSTSSDMLAYAGLQMAFAFFLGVLQGYAPASDLTVLRDRVVGILVGNVWMTLSFGLIWPVSALDRVRTSIGSALSDMGKLLVVDAVGARSMRLAISQKLAAATRLLSLSKFEWPSIRRRAHLTEESTPVIDEIQRLAGSVFTVCRLRRSDAAASEDAGSAQRLMALGKGQVAGERTQPEPVHEGNTGPSPLAEARSILDAEIDHVSKTL